MAKGYRHAVTVTDVAADLGISPTTVSLVLNGRAEEYRISPITADRVNAAARRMKYRPNAAARQLTGKRSNVVGVLINTPAVADSRLVVQMERSAAERGLRLIIGHAVGTAESARTYLEDFRCRGVDAVISIFHAHPDFSNLVHKELENFEHVIFYDKPDRAGQCNTCRYVEPDYYKVGQLGVEHLLSHGRKRPALVLNSLMMPYAQQRQQAYFHAMRTANPGLNGELVWLKDRDGGKTWMQPFDADDAQRVVDELILPKKADSIIAVNDGYAARLLLALTKRGVRVPDDVAIIGCDDTEIATMVSPAITSIDQRLGELAEGLISMLHNLLEEKPAERSYTLEPKLIIRESCGCK